MPASLVPLTLLGLALIGMFGLEDSRSGAFGWWASSIADYKSAVGTLTAFPLLTR